jgi:hypothetical protein
MPDMDSLPKIIELAAKFAWPVLAAATFLLFVPDHLSKQLGLDQLRTVYRGYIWLTLVFAAAVIVTTNAKSVVWRYMFCPLRKLLLPVTDAETGIRQSRRRYHRVEFRYRDGTNLVAFQEVDSNGNLLRYRDVQGHRLIPAEPHDCSPLDGRAFHHPRWGKLDWPDVFNGDKDSGCWGIIHR